LGNWRRIKQQFKVLFLFWFGVPVFAFYLLLSINKTAAPNWDALAFLSFGLLAVYFWRERVETSRWLKPAMGVAIFLSLLMTLLALDSDLLRTAGVHLPRHDPTNRLRGWKSGTAEVEKVRVELEAKLGEKLFVIANDRDRASEISFYLRDKRVEGPGHPPVYQTESQDLLNQFSLWPRYDEWTDKPPLEQQQGPDAYTEEHGMNSFVGRSAIFVRDGAQGGVPRNIKVAFQSTELVATMETQRYGGKVRVWQVFLCRNYKTLPL
jgi:hypothetical protein